MICIHLVWARTILSAARLSVEGYLGRAVAQVCIPLSTIPCLEVKEAMDNLGSIRKHHLEHDGIPLALAATQDSLVLVVEGEITLLAGASVEDLEEGMAETSSNKI
jgi:hypothetical protein